MMILGLGDFPFRSLRAKRGSPLATMNLGGLGDFPFRSLV